MKRFFAFFLAVMILISAIACNGGDNGTGKPIDTKSDNSEEALSETLSPQSTESTTAVSTTEGQIDPPEDPEVPINFCVGYAKADIAPEVFPIRMYSTQFAKASDELYATVIAFFDGETTSLVITVDLQQVNEVLFYKTAKVAKEFGIPDDNIMLSATHNHSGVSYASEDSDEGMRAWNAKYVRAIREGIKNALDDLAPADAYIGRTDTENFAFVRRYIMDDGSFLSIIMPSTDAKYKSHESEADPSLQAICFKREGEKDVVMVNWQAHPAYAVGMFKDIITADFVGNFRSGAEAEYGIEFAYYQGACGNINLNSFIDGKQIYKNYVQVGNALVGKLGEALENLTPVDTGRLKITKDYFTAEVDHSNDAQRELALSAYEAYNAGEVKTEDDIYDRFGFNSIYHVMSILTNYKRLKNERLPISTISFGDIAFASTPYEMFDTNGMQVKDGSPFKMTFICAYTNGSYGYVPSTAVYDHGGYEVYSTRYVKGTGDAVAQRLIEMLREQFDS